MMVVVVVMVMLLVVVCLCKGFTSVLHVLMHGTSIYLRALPIIFTYLCINETQKLLPIFHNMSE